MMDAIDTIKKYIYQYYGDFIFLIIAVIALVYLLVANKELRLKILVPTGVMMLCIVNPLLAWLLKEKYYYWRLFWIFPSAIIISLAIVKCVKTLSKVWLKLVILAISVLCIVKFGNNTYLQGGYVKCDNAYKISKETIDVCNIIFSIYDNPRCIASDTLLTEMRQYSGDVEMMYGRNIYGYIGEKSILDNDIYKALNYNEPCYETVLATMNYYNYDFLVCDSERPIQDDLLDWYRYDQVGKTNEYIIYYKEQNEDDEWLVTQYGSKSKWENSFYTIEKEDVLIIIDGGRGGFESKIEEVVREHNNSVDAWIISNTGKGHLEALNNILRNKRVEIDEIYLPEIDYERFKDTARYYEKIEIYEDFLELTKNADNINHVNVGDKIKIDNLDIKIYNSWDEDVNQEERDLSFKGSLVFSVEGEQNSMLFCSDVSMDVEQKLINNLKKDNAKFDYIQISNHGQEELPIDFYLQLEPKVAFIDVSLAHIDNEEHKNSVDALITKFKENNIRVYTFDSQPNRVLIR